MKHLKATFTTNEELVDESFRLPFFEDFEEINTMFEIKERKWQVTMMRLYQCGTAVYQLAKLRMFEICYDFLDKYLDWHDFELIQMDTVRCTLPFWAHLLMASLGQNYEKNMIMVENSSFYRLQSTMTELQDCLKLSFRARE